MPPLKLLIIGAPNAGKGTLCERISRYYGVVHMSTGDVLREEVKKGTDLGKRAQHIMAAGKLVPDDLMVDLIIKRMYSMEDIRTRGLLLDGFPRTAVQARALVEAGISFDAMVVLDVDEACLIDRCVGRRIDPVTGFSYHVKYHPPPTDEIAARCIVRADDTPEKLRTRIQLYNSEKDALMEVFGNIKLTLDANATMDEVFAQFNVGISEALTRAARRKLRAISRKAAKERRMKAKL